MKHILILCHKTNNARNHAVWITPPLTFIQKRITINLSLEKVALRGLFLLFLLYFKADIIYISKINRTRIFGN